ncbi:pyridoxamine kinase [Aerococcaceae bacterium DSM 111020]|nr:pyridoxamine kinase [Aerococcaceae bacterium DSM 111020]
MKNVLIIQDISGFGKCSTTVALPIVSACGVTGSIMPTAILSTHTGPEFPGFTFLDLTDNMVQMLKHWEELDIKFDAIYTGYLGRIDHVDLLIEHIPNILAPGGKIFIDPAFGDNGKYYVGFDNEYGQAQRKLVAIADYVLPNYTEACLLLERSFESLTYSEEELLEIMQELKDIGAKNVIITGVRQDKMIGAALLNEENELTYSLAKYIDQLFHGTGDVFAATVVGKYLNSANIQESIDTAVEFVPAAIQATLDDEDPITYGVHFEKVLHLLVP